MKKKKKWYVKSQIFNLQQQKQFMFLNIKFNLAHRFSKHYYHFVI